MSKSSSTTTATKTLYFLLRRKLIEKHIFNEKTATINSQRRFGDTIWFLDVLHRLFYFEICHPFPLHKNFELLLLAFSLLP